ncbi:hypothetical protein [Plantactinospora sp. GCM10030261]|uniref:hypothetical protein n=1 Tax=Plantactinospora sp. GCM10030261 TaxID=3273420 RepID=UPI00361E466F
MNIRRWSIVGVTAVVLVPGLAACQQADPDSTAGASGSPSPSASASPSTAGDVKQALLDSTREIGDGNFRFTLAAGATTGSGVVHKPSRSAQLTMTLGQADADLAMGLDLIYVDPESWVKVKLSGPAATAAPGLDRFASDKYLHVDPARAQNIKDLRFDFNQVDPAGSEALTKAVVDVKSEGSGRYTGTIDLTKATEGAMADKRLVTALGSQASSLPFEAAVDEQGRLSKLTIQVPATQQTKAQDLTVSYSDYGSATPPQKPAASETQEAPPELYGLFNQ